MYYSISDKYKDIDILIINSTLRSGQYNNNKLDELCVSLDKIYNIVTTIKINKIKCTIDDNLSLQHIASIATNTKYIISVMTGPLCVLYNKETKITVKNGYYYL